MTNDYFPWPTTEGALPDGWKVYIIEGDEIEAPDRQSAIECWHAINSAGMSLLREEQA